MVPLDAHDLEKESSTDLARAWEQDAGMRRRARRFEFVTWHAWSNHVHGFHVFELCMNVSVDCISRGCLEWQKHHARHH